MLLSLFMLVLVLSGQGQTWAHQSLTCRHEPHQRVLRKVWCKQSSEQCCSGFALPHGESKLELGHLQVQQDPEFFTITPGRLPQGAGVYWCGLLHENNTITRLATQYFPQATPDIWGTIRWALMPLLPLMAIVTHLYTCRRRHVDDSI